MALVYLDVTYVPMARAALALRTRVRTRFRSGVGVLGLLAAVGFAGCSAPKEVAAPVAAPPVEAVSARVGSLPLVERLSGTVRAENQVALYPELSGRIAEVLVADGQRVEAGQALVRLADEGVREQVRQAEAGLRIQRARLRQSEANLAEIDAQAGRMRELGARNLVSEAELETLAARRESAAADVALAEAQVEQAAAALAERQDDLTRTVIRAPINGVVGNRMAELGMQVGTGTRLFVIGNLARMSVRLNLTDSMLAYLRPGQTVRIYVSDTTAGAAAGGSLDARLTRISPFLNETTRSTEAEVELDNPDGSLRPGMFVPVDIFYGESRRATLAPVSALFTDPNTGSEGVFVVTSAASDVSPDLSPPGAGADLGPPQPVTFRPVQVIARGASEIAIDRVQPGEWVVTLGQNLLATGRAEARVRRVDWEHVLGLQGLKREALLTEVLRVRGE